MSMLALPVCAHCGSQYDATDFEPLTACLCPTCGGAVRSRQSINQFELQEVLATGGMGTVYRAYDTQLHRTVALKVLLHKFCHDTEYIETLQSEAAITAAIVHPNVVRIYSFGSVGDDFFIALEFLRYGTLAQRILKTGKQAEQAGLQFGLQIAAGLKAAQEKGLLHRDVKPDNILFSDPQTVKITDFSLAAFLNKSNGEARETWMTPHYVAPEKLQSQSEDLRSDIYSLGATLYHAFSARTVFDGENSLEIAQKHIDQEIPDLRQFAPHISAETIGIVHRMLAKDPDDRYQNYDDLLAALETAMEAENFRRARHPSRKRRHKVQRPEMAVWSMWNSLL